MTFSDLVAEAQEKAESDAVIAGLTNDHIPVSEGGTGALAYGQAIGVYLAFVIDKMTDYHSSICSWHNSRELIRNTFGITCNNGIIYINRIKPFGKKEMNIKDFLNGINKEEFKEGKVN